MKTQEPVSRPVKPLAELTALLREREVKVTGHRQAILERLRQEDRPVSIKEIQAALPRGDCDLATIYRAVHVLERVGLVQRFDFGDGAARFELARAGTEGHHHHLVCRRCAEVVEIAECFASELERRISAASGYQQVTHRLEFFGLCPGCQQAPAAEDRKLPPLRIQKAGAAVSIE